MTFLQLETVTCRISRALRNPRWHTGMWQTEHGLTPGEFATCLAKAQKYHAIWQKTFARRDEHDTHAETRGE